MKSLVIVFLTITVVTAKNFCTPGSVFKNDCNFCTCSLDGKTAACTEMTCIDKTKTYATQKQQYCEPGKRFKIDDCNTCTCSNDGTKAKCTLALCPSNKDNIATKNDKYCTPGSTFRPDNCNTCRCNSDGTKAMCTLTMCPDNKLDVMDKKFCEPGKVFKMDECNTCICSNDGTNAKCTLGLCPLIKKKTPTKTEKYCTPGSVFSPDSCNTCQCNGDGTRAMCTLTMCPDDTLDKQSKPKQICKPGASFKDYCNTCFCADDGKSFGCTRMWCDKEIWNKDGTKKVDSKPQKVQSAAKRVCKPGSQFKDYCNICFCSDDGSSFACSRMMCDKEIWNKDGTMKKVTMSHRVVRSVEKQVCTPNAQFKEYCNSCVCSNDGMSKVCTMMDCDEELYNSDGSFKDESEEVNSDSDKVCEPGTTFSPDGCNTCVCNEYGTESACTVKLCLNTRKQAYKVDETEKWGPIYKDGDACTPGKSFYSECNQCVCTSSGKSAMCTLMDCQADT